MQYHTRRSFIAAGSVAVTGSLALGSTMPRAQTRSGDAEAAGDIARDPASRIQAFVRASHFPIDKVREMLAINPDLAKSGWDWGFGDYESAISACSHTGQFAIIELLLKHGARPTLFTFATLDKVDTVKIYIESVPNARAIEGPHSISLYRHAVAGKASRVMEYLESVGLKSGSEIFETDLAMASPYFGEFAWGTGDAERFTVKWAEKSGCLTIKTSTISQRNLIPMEQEQGLSAGLVFRPAGSQHARVIFHTPDRLVVQYADQEWMARRIDA